MNPEATAYLPVAEPRPEAFVGQQTKVPDRPLIASGGNRLNLPPDIKDLQYELHRKRIEAKSEGFYNAFAERIQTVRQRMEEEYGDYLVINDPPHVVPSWENRNQRQDETGLAYFVEDPQGTFLPHSRKAIIRDHRLSDDDSEISGTHWIEGYHYKTDAQGNFLLDAKGRTIPLGEFIMGPDGAETVVKFQIYVREDGHWLYYGKDKNPAVQTEAPLLPVILQITPAVIFEDHALTA